LLKISKKDVGQYSKGTSVIQFENLHLLVTRF